MSAAPPTSSSSGLTLGAPGPPILPAAAASPNYLNVAYVRTLKGTEVPPVPAAAAPAAAAPATGTR